MAIEPIKGFYVHDEVTDTDGVAKYDAGALENLDRSLTERYRAPDSKAVGDRFGAVEAVADEANEIAKRLNEGGLELKDEVLAENISAWLNEHPEATTTVEDGALVQSKLSDSLDARKPSFYSTVSEMQEDEQLRLGTTAISNGAVYTVRSAVEVNDPEDMVDPSVLYKYDGQYYHGGLTEDDREIATGFECASGFALFVAEYKNSYVTPEMFGAKGDGVADDTKAWQKAVDVGLPVIAKSAQYKCGTINVTKNISIDCNWAEFVCTANKLFYCTGEVVTTIAGDNYTASQPYSITNAQYANYTGFAMLKGTNNFELSRTYYLGGFVCQFKNGSICGTYPIDVENVTIEIVNPITVIISNIGELKHNNPTTSTYLIHILYGLGCLVNSAVAKNASSYMWLDLDCCLNCCASNLNVEHSFTSSNNNSYIVAFLNSSFCSVKDSYLYNEKWHCVTTGDKYLCYHNTIENSTTLSKTMCAICDHENGLNTVVKNTVSSEIYLGGLCDISDVVIKPLQDTYKSCRVALSPVSNSKNAVYNVRNVLFDVDTTATNNNYIGVWLRQGPQVTGNTYYFSDVRFKNLKNHKTPVGNFSFSLPQTANFVIGSITIDDTNINIGLGDNMSNLDITNYELRLKNIQEKTAFGIHVSIGGATYNYHNVYMDNCRLRNIAGTYDDLIFSNLYVSQTLSSTVVNGCLYGTGLHSRFSNDLLLRPAQLKITDMTFGNLAQWFNIAKGNDRKCYYQRWVSGVLTTYEITV